MEEMELELGSLLKKARQEKGLTLADIQEETKIRKKYLEAIEENNFDILPGKVYLKVFIKGYAREVGLNYQELLDKYEVLNLKEKEESNLQKNYIGETKVSNSSPKRNRKKPFKIIFIVLLIIFLGAAAVYTFQYVNNSEIRLLNQQSNQETNIEEESQLVEVNEEQAEEANNETGEDNLETAEDSNNNSSLEADFNSSAAADNQELNLDLLDSFDTNLLNEDDIEVIEENNFGELDEFNYQEQNEITEIILSEEGEQQLDNEDKQITDDNLDRIDESSTAEENQTENDEETLAADQGNNEDSDTESSIENNEEAVEDKRIVIRASDTVWITVDLDGNNVFSGILEADDQQEFEIENRLYIKIGNGNAITANINGNSYGPWAGNGEIAEVEFLNEDGEIDINNLRE